MRKLHLAEARPLVYTSHILRNLRVRLRSDTMREAYSCRSTSIMAIFLQRGRCHMVARGLLGFMGVRALRTTLGHRG